MNLRIAAAIALSVTSVSHAIDKVVYGPDDRLDVFEVKEAGYRLLARSTAAMIPNEKLRIEGDSVSIAGETLASRGVCEGEKFADQITAANCTGFLVADNLLVTAGHCVRSASDCHSSAWVFDYSYSGTQQATFSVPSSSVYRCAEIVEQVLDSYNTQNDYALIRLERKVTDRAPLKVRTEGKIDERTSIMVIGHPTGLPTKVSDNAWVRSNDNLYYFVANLDTFGGNSGSPVFDVATGVVEGILVRGESDYEYDFERGCRKPKYCDDNDCRGEDVTRITNVKKLMQILGEGQGSGHGATEASSFLAGAR